MHSRTSILRISHDLKIADVNKTLDDELYNFRINAYRTSYRTIFTKKELDRETKGGGTMPKLESQNVSYGFESVFSALLLTLMCKH